MNVTITNEFLTATINPLGAELISLKDSSNEYIWEGNPEFWGKHSPILFPIVGTLKDNTYTYEGNDYNMTRHGFARDNHFVVKERDSRSVVFSFSSNEETLKQYPFTFELELKYTLKEKTLHLDYTVKNLGDKIQLFALGAHPAFALPGNFEDYSLTFEKEEGLISSQLENDLVSEKTVKIESDKNKLVLSHKLFENDALIFKTLISKKITLNKLDTPFLNVNFHDFPHLGIWTKANAPFLCIEPWQGYSDSSTSTGKLEDKEGIVLLATGKEYNAGFSIEILR
ncbi:aldose 1-epimerase family protein [Flavobacterium sp. AG291]|uniref:aldose 1-epimerase family protein n=1 Tax=Flavobacterium sp. AG291 TaxID=2184000 RepID=UPI000E0A4377|nr:aldose 1-epimerase family protein [Flavobacterium sp. AG291]RDI04438.1 galactose mutarotase-like enzyme [Flavobacterium sp. AG291]